MRSGEKKKRESDLEKDRYTPSLCHFYCEVLVTENHNRLDDAVTQLCPVVTKHWHCARPVQSSQNGIKAIVVAGVLNRIMVFNS